MENIVHLQLRRMKKNNPQIEIFYWKDYQQNEVDFAIKEGLNIIRLIQVTFASSFDEIDRREIKALVKASTTLKCKNLLTITWDLEDRLKVENKIIEFTPLFKWILNT